VGHPNLSEYRIGTGGWAYFNVPGLNRLVAYSRTFDFVEVNSTYYHMPSVERAKSWRRLVPEDFRFSVRAHRSIAGKFKFRPIETPLETFERMKEVCAALEADVLHFQVPASFKIDSASVCDIRDFFSAVNLGSLRIAMEVRGTDSSNIPREMLRMMHDRNMVHSVDLSKNEKPAYDSDILYTRLFGKGKNNVYQPTDGELMEIDAQASSGKSRKVAMSFHFVKMYKDAARMKAYMQTGKFPKVTRSTGASSLEEILSEDARFPATKQELVQKQGWKLIDYTPLERIHASRFLEKLPDKIYTGIDEVKEELQGVYL
jgi:uncharacterized protein YecE (DUF72 family)